MKTKKSSDDDHPRNWGANPRPPEPPEDDLWGAEDALDEDDLAEGETNLVSDESDSEEGFHHSVDVRKEEEHVMKALSGKEKSRKNVFTKTEKERVDDTAKLLHRHLIWQQSDGTPRTSFPHGISNLTKLQGHERTGILLVLLIVFVREHWAFSYSKKKKIQAGEAGHLEEAFGSERFANMIKSLYLLITHEAYMKWRAIPVATLKRVEGFTPTFLDQVTRAFNRTEKCGNNTLKNHFPLHLARDIRRFGSPANFDSGPGETLHKFTVKEPGKRTNYNHKTFESQAAKRHVENLSIERGFMDCPAWRGDLMRKKDERLPTTHGGHILSVRESVILSPTGSKLRVLPAWKESCVSAAQLVELIRELIIPNMPGSNPEVPVHTRTLRFGEDKFHANPSCGETKRVQQDWALVNFQGEGDFPCQLLCIVHVRQDLKRQVQIGRSKIKDAGHCALVHSATHALTEVGDPLGFGGEWKCGTLAQADQTMMHFARKEMQQGGNEPQLHVVDCETITSRCTSVPKDIGEKHDIAKQTEFFLLINPGEWGKLFEQHAVRHHNDSKGGTH